MVNIRSSDRDRKGANIGSPRTEIGEIDTRAPFQSVKAAVSLFGEVAISRQKSTPRRSRLSSENVLDKETQLMLAQKELDKIKKKLETAETTKSKALSDLDRTKKTMTDLKTKLGTVNKAKQTAIQAKEVVKQQAEELELQKSTGPARIHELDQAREQYLKITVELDATKQELTKIRQDFDVALESKLASFQQAAEAQRAAKANSERAGELTKEVAAIKEAIQQLKFATVQAQEDQVKIGEEGKANKQIYKNAKEEAEYKLQSLKDEYDPDLTSDLEAKLAETTGEIEILQAEMKKVHALEMDTVRVITNDLNQATEKLQEVADEENRLRNLVSSLRTELEEAKNEHEELNRKEAERIAIQEAKLLAALEEDRLKLEKLLFETENARKEAAEMKKNTDELNHETELTRVTSQEREKKLHIILDDVEEAKIAEKRALDEMRHYSDRQEETQIEQSPSMINISSQELEALKRKVYESENLVEAQVAAAEAETAIINARKIELDGKMEANLVAIEEIKTATDMAFKSAEMSAAAQTMVEGELRKWRHEPED